MKPNKKVLIVSYYWPPAGGISPLRILKFVKYLRRFGWEPVVVVPEKADYLYYDDTYLKDIPENLEIHRTKIWEPFGAYRLLSGRGKKATNNPVYGNNAKKSLIDELSIWIRGNFFIPDARMFWIRPTVKYLSRYLKDNKVDAILTDGPPHTNTVIGMRLAQKFNIPWLADFQDPWTQVDYYAKMKIGKHADRKHRRLEQEVFRTARKITIASPTWAKDLESIGARNVDVIYYGYDEDDFRDLKPSHNDDRFIISHTGIMGPDRNPETLFRVLRDMTVEDPEFARRLRLVLAGPVDPAVSDAIKTYGLEAYYEAWGNIPRRQALQLNMDSGILLLPINKAPNAKGRLPGKLYEYLRVGRPVLALGPEDSDAAEIIRQTQAGTTLPYDDYERIRTFVSDIFHGRQKISPMGVEKFSNLNQTGKLASFLDQITQG